MITPEQREMIFSLFLAVQTARDCQRGAELDIALERLKEYYGQHNRKLIL